MSPKSDSQREITSLYRDILWAVNLTFMFDVRQSLDLKFQPDFHFQLKFHFRGVKLISDIKFKSGASLGRRSFSLCFQKG